MRIAILKSYTNFLLSSFTFFLYIKDTFFQQKNDGFEMELSSLYCRPYSVGEDFFNVDEDHYNFDFVIVPLPNDPKDVGELGPISWENYFMATDWDNHTPIPPGWIQLNTPFGLTTYTPILPFHQDQDPCSSWVHFHPYVLGDRTTIHALKVKPQFCKDFKGTPKDESNQIATIFNCELIAKKTRSIPTHQHQDTKSEELTNRFKGREIRQQEIFQKGHPQSQSQGNRASEEEMSFNRLSNRLAREQQQRMVLFDRNLSNIQDDLQSILREIRQGTDKPYDFGSNERDRERDQRQRADNSGAYRFNNQQENRDRNRDPSPRMGRNNGGNRFNPY